jgi:hypothetical protein
MRRPGRTAKGQKSKPGTILNKQFEALLFIAPGAINRAFVILGTRGPPRVSLTIINNLSFCFG